MLDVITMANQDILHNLWIKNKMSMNDVLLEDIGKFADENKHKLNAKSLGGITPSGLNYAVLKFILDYCNSVNWDKTEFLFAKNPNNGEYGIWRKHFTYKVNVMNVKIA